MSDVTDKKAHNVTCIPKLNIFSAAWLRILASFQVLGDQIDEAAT